MVQPKSLSTKLKTLQEELKITREILGNKEIENELLYKIIDLISEDYGIDIDNKYYKKKPYCHGLKKRRS